MPERGFCECGCGEPTQGRWARGHHMKRTGPLYVVEDRGHDTPCWIWQRGLSGGYGRVRVGVKVWKWAHRLYWERLRGPVPQGLELDHLCRNTRCVNPDHLEPVTHAENLRRSHPVKLTLAAARDIRESQEPAKDVADRLGVSRAAIYDIRHGRTWKEGEARVA